jgi:hypothetical protein
MSIGKSSTYSAFAATIALAGFLWSPNQASAGLTSALDECSIAPEDRAALTRLHDDIAHAPNLDEARSLALAPTDAALDAVGKARAILPLSEDLREAQARLAERRARIEAAKSPPLVADEFSGMTLAGLDDDRLIHAKVGGHGCSYSTGETIAIVIGLILGIIPGLVLLIVLC